MSYIVLARKYRPQNFNEVIKQKHVTDTLSNAILSDRVAHAHLFCGPRGTGKTTIARVFAKALNCKNGPIVVPCETCRSCIEIKETYSPDVFEIDGASNNSVDQIRELRDNLKYLPSHSRYKIYIIDEVHMLSQAAFNALLKTLEEPPAHVIFMFATTEVNKIPATILSRCQRHDLRIIDLNSIINHMSYICDKEKIKIDTKSLSLIAKESQGCMRDALSLLDQVFICTTEPDITYTKTLEILSLIDRKILFDISENVFNKNVLAILNIIDSTYNRGYDLKKFYKFIIEHFRNLLICKMGESSRNLIDLPENEINLMCHQTNKISVTFLTQLLDILIKDESQIKYSQDPKIIIEMLFIKLFQIKHSMPIDSLIDKIDNLYSFANKIKTEPVLKNEKSEKQKPETDKKHSANSQAAHLETETETEIKQKTEINYQKPLDISSIDKNSLWQKIQTNLSKNHPSLAAHLTKSTIKTINNKNVEININGTNFNHKMVKRQKSMDALKDVFKDTVGVLLNINIFDKPEEVLENKKADIKNSGLNNPFVTEAIKIFEGRIVEIKNL